MKKIFIIFLLAFFVRIFYISKVPYSLNWDEATFGYNSYSILKTLRDEYGTLLPLQFKSIGDYKAPLYVYLSVPFVALFGLNELSVRFAPAFFGSLSIVFFYLIVKKLFKKENLAFFSSIFLIVSPWHIQFTRAGADVGVSTFFVLGGIYYSLLKFVDNKNTLTMSFLFFSLSMYSYFADRLFTPLIALAMLVIFIDTNKLFKFLLENKKSFLLGVIFMLPILLPLLSKGHQEKIYKTTILSQSRPSEYIEYLETYSVNKNFHLVFHNKFYEMGMGIIDRYLSHFSLSFLFSKGAEYDGRQMIFRMGNLYFFQFPLLLLGVISLFQQKNKKIRKFIIAWILIAPLPAAITNDPVHSRRSFNMVYPYSIVSALGLYYFFQLQFNKLVKIIFSVLFFIFVLFNILFYFFSYTVFTPNRTFVGSAGWQWGYKELVSVLEKYEDKYSKIVVDTTYQGPYVYFLFYKKYSPYSYQPQAKLVQDSPTSLGEGAGFDNYEFRPIYWPDDRKSKNILYAGPVERIPFKDIDLKESKILETIYFPNGEIAYLIVETY